MSFGLRLAGTSTIAFRCGCYFARGDATGVAGWRLCPAHGDLQPTVAHAFGEATGDCVVICGLAVEPIRDPEAAALS